VAAPWYFRSTYARVRSLGCRRGGAGVGAGRCGSSERARPPAVAPADAGPAPAVRVEVPALGTDRLDGWGWRRGPGAAAFGRALAAERAGDLPTLEREATAALAADPGHLEAAWLAAVARARLGRLDEVLAPLQVAAAGDWGKWGERSLELAALEAFRASAAGRGWVEAAGRHRDAYQEALRRAVVVLGARVGERGAGVGRELYAVDVRGRPLAAPDPHRRCRWRARSPAARRAAGSPTPRPAARCARKDGRVDVTDRASSIWTTGRASREVALRRPAPPGHAGVADAARWRGRAARGGGRHAATARGRGSRWSTGAAASDRTGGRAGVRCAASGSRSPPMRGGPDGACRSRGLSADWDDRGTASAVRFDRSGKVVDGARRGA
jgi:hypothetical protein